MLKMAVIGTGDHSRIHHGAPCAALSGRIDRAAVCSLDADSAAAYAREFGFRQSFTDVERMIETVRPDLLVAVTPVAVNFSMAKKLIPYRIPLLMEKPPGENSAQTAELLELAETCGARVMVSFNRRFSPVLERLRGWLAERPELSPPALLRASMLRVARLEPEFIMATAIHSLDAIIALMGEPDEVEVRAVPGACRALQALMSFPGGSLGTFLLHPDSGVVSEDYELSGTGWRLRADFINGTFEAWQDGVETGAWRVEADVAETVRSGALDEMTAFVDAAEQGLAFKPDLRHGLAVMRLAEKLRRSVAVASERK